MGNSTSVKLSPEIGARTAKVAGMTLLEIRTLALSIMGELTAGSIAARDADAIQRAIERRIKAHQCGRASRQQIERRVLSR
jgi:hypothetical protein